MMKEGISMKISNISLAGALAVGMTLSVQAAPASPLVQHEQLEQARQADQARTDRLKSTQIQREGLPSAPDTTPSVSGGPSFRIDVIRIEQMVPEMRFLSAMTAPYTHKHLDMATVNTLVQQMNQALIEKGYATSRVVIPEQNLHSGTLVLALQAGRIRHVVYSEGSAKLPWRTSFPCWEGDLLNVHLLEQGLEQMQRLASQNVTMRLLPTGNSSSDIELTIKRSNPAHAVVSADDSGLSSTGRTQISTDIVLDNPFYGNDTLQLGLNGDGTRDGYDRGTRGQSIAYTIPYGKDTFSVSYSRYKYHQTVPSDPYDFISGGKSDVGTVTWDHLLSRNQSQKTSMDISIRKRNSHSYINDMEIPIQTLHTTALEIGLSQRVYLTDGTLYVRAGHRMGLGWFGAQPENTYDDSPRTRYHMWLFDADYQKPLTLGHRPAAFTASFHGQWTTSGARLYGVDMISMGNRYTVRGFDGEYTLMGESGWYLRNELSSSIAGLNSDLYIGLDVGKVYGPGTSDLVGNAIAGAVIGLRGSFSSGLSYDAFVGAPIYKPDGFHTDKTTAGFTVSWRF